MRHLGPVAPDVSLVLSEDDKAQRLVARRLADGGKEAAVDARDALSLHEVVHCATRGGVRGRGEAWEAKEAVAEAEAEMAVVVAGGLTAA